MAKSHGWYVLCRLPPAKRCLLFLTFLLLQVRNELQERSFFFLQIQAHVLDV